ncbi:nuclear transport factor 2 family protein [Novosphingobium sp. JCM 18896]|uniref:nuclear transport factor 2 family protein n=1 Tax=Novosphingobium sp. JCM 18896 TaxID=2989731 RepID=UPI00222256D1|nr:nuclear transport factor 2 family protein [Novosphingobium sp. JCM 18896]MCW1432297.1 nuclear transport factor 2 family protein [Novosphingobium sp. JCM 18896]
MAEAPTATELRELLESRKIERVLFDYAHNLDINQPEEMTKLFTDDCVVTYAPNFGAEGKDAYRETLNGIGTYFSATTHHVSNVVIDFIDENTAQVRSVLMAIHRYTRERPDGWMFGQYHDTMVKGDNGQWQFKRRELRTTMGMDYHVKTSHPLGRAE